ncbi:MAG: protoheme IX farnesyltransferase [Acidobacteria bacterium]|nr:protoheme IX farnesyltransferase [Acidobacteriota bacterium]
MKQDAIAYSPTSTASSHSKAGDLAVLAKPRLNALVVATTAGGYYMAGPAEIDLTALALTCLGTALVASGASAVNQVYERDTDRLMTRTRTRPMAEGRMSVIEALLFAAFITVAGLGLLWAVATPEAVWVALATFVSYVAIYTPLKRRTSFSTVIGAVPGALPPLIGWAAVRGSVSGIEPWSRFFIMFLWPMPHFLAIAWMYREDYARAGMPMLSVIDPNGAFTGRQALLWAASLVPFGLLPFLLGMTTGVYAIGALVLGLAQLALAVGFARHRSIANARTLFFASIIYLPLLWILMVLART